MKKLLTIMIILILATAAFADSIFSMRAAGAFDFVSYTTPKSTTDKPDYTLSFDHTQVKTPGFGFDVGADLKLSESIVLYGDFSMVFPSKITVGNEGYSKAMAQEMVDFYKDAAEKGEIAGDPDHHIYKNIDGKAFLSTVSAHLGFAKLINTGSSVFGLTLGGGVGYTRTSSGFKMTMVRETSDGKLYHMDNYEVYSDLSLDLYVNARYQFSDHFSVGATVMPGFIFFSSSKQYATVAELAGEKYPVPVSSEDYYKADGLGSGITPKYENSGFCAGFSLNTAIGVTFHF